MKIQIRNILVATIAIAFASCNKPNTQGKLIPKDAAVAVVVDGKSLSAKLPWAEVKENAAFKEAYSDTAITAAMKAILDNPDNSGIDVKNDLIFFMQKDSIGGYAAFEGTVKDPAIFKNFNKQFTDKGKESEKDGVTYVSTSSISIGWNKEKFVYIFDAPQMSHVNDLYKRMERDSIDISNIPRHTRDVDAACKAVFALKESNSLADEKRFTALVNEPGDIHFWLNTEEWYKQGADNLPAAMAMLNIEKLYKGSRTGASVNFDNGKLSVTSHSYPGEELVKIYSKYGGGKVNEDMIKRMPGKEVMAIIAINYKPELIQEYAKLLGVDGWLNLGLKKTGFTMEEFIKATKGDVIIGISDFKLASDTTKFLFKDKDAFQPTLPKPELNFVFATSINDKDAFNKIVNAAKNLGLGTFTDDGKEPMAYSSNGSLFALANNKENADKYLAGGSSNGDFTSKMSGQALGGYVNIHSLMKNFEGEANKDSTDKAIYDLSLKIWDNATWKGGDFSNGAVSNTFEINLLDKSTNSLKQLNDYANKLSILHHQKKQQEKAGKMAFDDLINAPSPETEAK